MIPKAEEYFDNFKDLPKHMDETISSDIARVMIEFAKLHVEAALKAAAKRHRETQTYEIEHKDIVNSAILNAYPLTNIK